MVGAGNRVWVCSGTFCGSTGLRLGNFSRVRRAPRLSRHNLPTLLDISRFFYQAWSPGSLRLPTQGSRLQQWEEEEVVFGLSGDPRPPVLGERHGILGGTSWMQEDQAHMRGLIPSSIS